MKAPERAGRSSKAGEPADGSQTGKNDASRSHRPPGADPAPTTRSESRKGPSETTHAQPSLNEILEVLSRLPATAQADGWRALPKSDVMTACRKCGVRVTHGRLGKLAQDEPGRFAVEGIIVKYRP